MEFENISLVLQKLAKENTDLVPLSVDELIEIHDICIDSFGGIKGIRDEDLLKSVSIAPFQSCFGTNLFPGLIDKAAKYLFDFANYQIFLDGNKRTALASAAVFFQKNGLRFSKNADVTLWMLVFDVANHVYNNPSEIVPMLRDSLELIPERNIIKENHKIDRNFSDFRSDDIDFER